MRVEMQDEEGFEVQMAPLIDCVFLLLIFFLVATTLRKIDHELPLDLPESMAAIEVQQPDDVTVISIDREHAFHLNGTPVSVGMLQDELRTLVQTNPDSKLRLDVDRLVPMQRVMEILDVLQFEGLSNVGINTTHQNGQGRR
jgi:biopolymer transport protein ExbD